MAIKACVFGAGAIGCFLAAFLSRSGSRVSLVARGPHLETIRGRGVTIHTHDGSVQHFDPDAASDDPKDLGEQDIVFVTVKSTALGEVAAHLAPLLSSNTAIVFVGNGIPWWYPNGQVGSFGPLAVDAFDPGSALHRATCRNEVIGGVIYSACTMIAPGVIRCANVSDKLVIGGVDGREQGQSASIAALLEQVGLACDVTDDIRREVWSKLMTNLGSAPICLLTRQSIAESYADPAVRSAAVRLVEEGRAIAEGVLGKALPGSAEAVISIMAALDHKPSILQDFELGRPMEIDALLTRPQRLAGLAGVRTPLLDLLTALARKAGDVSADRTDTWSRSKGYRRQ